MAKSRVRFEWLVVNMMLLATMLLIPPWKIVHYEWWPGMESSIRGDIRSDPISGTWGPLRWAPVWNPPHVFLSDRNEFNILREIDAPTRWPWMKAKPGYASEIDMTRLVASFSLLVILNSILAVFAARSLGKPGSRKWVRILAAMGAGQMLGWFGFGLLGAASMGFAWQPVTFYMSLGAGLFASCLYLGSVCLRGSSPAIESTATWTSNQTETSMDGNQPTSPVVAPLTTELRSASLVLSWRCPPASCCW